MANQKLENLLNLALETEEEVREKSLNLNVGFEEQTRSWELIVKYNGNPDNLRKEGVVVEELLAGFAILTVPESLVDSIAKKAEIEYVEKPKRLFFVDEEGKEASCVLEVSLREPYLDGEGVLVAIIDSGIDFTNPLFRNPDGSSRILYLWDQSIMPDEAMGRKPPDGFFMGTEFTKEQIDRALDKADFQEAYQLLPSRDVSGHGTAVAGIAAGKSDSYEGVAPAAELIIVKLGIPNEFSFPRTTELMRALTYVVKKAQDLAMPVAVNISFGNTYGAHDGTSLLERFIDNVSEVGRCVICVGSGNEGASAGHIQGNLQYAPDRVGEAELSVAEYETALNVQLWKNYVDKYHIIIRSPAGEERRLPEPEAEKVILRMEQTDILVYLGKPNPYAVSQEIYFDFIPIGQYITPGIWTFRIEGIKIVTGQYYFYLPGEMVRNRNTRFFGSTPQVTMTIPSTSQKVITVGAYDTTYDAYADFSGRGYVYPERTMGLVAAGVVKPDLVAPGVNIIAPDVYGNFRQFSGTSFATPFVTGAAALMMQWGIVRGNDPFLYGEKVKAYLRQGARPLRGEEVYPNERVGFGALCVSNSIPGEQALQ